MTTIQKRLDATTIKAATLVMQHYKAIQDEARQLYPGDSMSDKHKRMWHRLDEREALTDFFRMLKIAGMVDDYLIGIYAVELRDEQIRLCPDSPTTTTEVNDNE